MTEKLLIFKLQNSEIYHINKGDNFVPYTFTAVELSQSENPIHIAGSELDCH
jgi:hypothetical protein